MKNLMILVKMQLKEQLNFKRLDVENVSVFNILVSIFGAILKFAMVTALCFVFLLVSKMLNLFSLTNTVPSSVISLVFALMLMVSTFSCVVGLTKSMYYARDNAVLLTLPCLPIQVYLSKLIIFFIFEFKRNLSFIVPLFIAYFYTHNYPWFAYPWMLFAIIWISLFTVSIGALLSIPAMWIANFFRQRKWLQMGGLAAVVALAVAALFYVISLIPEDIDIVATWGTTYWQIQDFLNAYMSKFSFVYKTSLLILGETHSLVTTLPFLPTFLRFIALSGATVLLLGAGLLIVRPLFYKMASTPFEYLKKNIPPRKNKVRTRRFSAVYNEFLIAFKSTDRMFSNVGVFIAIPILIFLLNKIFLAMNTRVEGDYMVIAFNVLIILLVALNANCSAASIFSKDGRSSYLIKTQPSKYPILILSKLLPNTMFVCLSIAATFFVMLATLPLAPMTLVVLVAAIGMTYVSHMLYCAEQDLMNPQVELYATVGASESNPNETRATLTAFLASFVIAALIFILLLEGSKHSVYTKYVLLAFAVMVYRIWMFFAKLRLYYKEK